MWIESKYTTGLAEPPKSSLSEVLRPGTAARRVCSYENLYVRLGYFRDAGINASGVHVLRHTGGQAAQGRWSEHRKRQLVPRPIHRSPSPRLFEATRRAGGPWLGKGGGGDWGREFYITIADRSPKYLELAILANLLKHVHNYFMSTKTDARQFPFQPFETMFKSLVVSDTLGDDVAHVLVRCQFLRRLFESGRLKTLYGQYLDLTGLRGPLAEIAAASDKLAAVLGYPSRAHFHAAGADRARAIEAFLETTAGRETLLDAHQMWDRANAHAQQVLLTLDVAVSEDMRREATRFVTSIKCRWVWLAAEVFDGFLDAIASEICGGMLTTTVELMHPEASSDPVPSAPVQEPGESVESYLARVRAYASDIQMEIRQRSKPRGKVPKDRVEDLKRYSDWLYQSRVEGLSLREIARRSFPGEPPDSRRKNVKYGIGAAEKAMSLGAYEFTGPDELEVRIRREAFEGGKELNPRKLARVNYQERDFSP